MQSNIFQKYGNNNGDDISKLFEKDGIDTSQGQVRQIIERINNIITYHPKIGIFGKTGVGKSSLCNSLFGAEICKVSDVEACTRETKEVLVSIGDNNKGITLIDVPGVGESRDRDDEYSNLYKELLPELDLILWVIKADDRALASDERFYNEVVKYHLDDKKPFFFVLNQVDKIEPFREWDDEQHQPSDKQFKNIDEKVRTVANFFNVAYSKVIPISANEKYNLTTLVDEFIRALPPEKIVSTFRSVEEEFQTEETKEYVKKTFKEKVLDVIEVAAVVVDKIWNIIRPRFFRF